MTDTRRMIDGMSEMQQEPAVPDWTLGWRLRRALDHAGLTVEGARSRAAYAEDWLLVRA